MNEKKAKYFRKQLYGDMSLKEPRKYYRGDNGGIMCDGIRGRYQRLKRLAV